MNISLSAEFGVHELGEAQEPAELRVDENIAPDTDYAICRT
jgi:hypothetical protein